MSSKPKYQSTMDSFFSAGKGSSSSKPKMKQSKINFGSSNKNKTKDEKQQQHQKKSSPGATNDKENVIGQKKTDKAEAAAAAKEEKEECISKQDKSKDDDLQLEDTDDEQDTIERKTSSPTKKTKSPQDEPSNTSSKKKRRIIGDDDSDDDADDNNSVGVDDDDKTVEMEDNASEEKDDHGGKHNDDDEDFVPQNDENDDDEEMKDVVDDGDDDDGDEKLSKLKKTKKNDRKTSVSPSSKVKSTTALKDTSKKTTKKVSISSNSKNQNKSEVFAAGMKSEDKLLKDKEMVWARGTCIPYKVLCNVFEKIEEISGRLEIQELLTELFRRTILLSLVAPSDGSETEKKKESTTASKKKGNDKMKKNVVKDDPTKDMYDLIYLASNTVAPSYECVELGIGDSILIKAIGEAYGTNPSIVKQTYEKEGDLGLVASQLKGKQRTLNFGVKPKPLVAKNVLETYRQIAKTTGNSSQKYKISQIKGLLVRAQGNEAKYIIRGLQGKLRIGLARTTVLISLAHAVSLTPPKSIEDLEVEEEDTATYPDEAKVYIDTKQPLDKHLDAAVSIIKKAYSEIPSYDALLDAALKVPLQLMHKECTLTPGIPVEPMLAKPTKSIQEVLKRLNGQNFTCEYKYDGERAQVHMSPDGKTSVFSRNLLDTSEKFPEIPKYVKEAAATTASTTKGNDDGTTADDPVTSFVLDTEVVAYNRETKQLVPFQVLSTRKKTETSDETAKVQVIVQAFDLMYLNGKSLLSLTLNERRSLMKKYFKPVDGKFQYATSLDHKEDGDTTVLEEFLEAAVKNQCEGLMVKTLDDNAAYEPSKRSLNWLKLKKDYLEGLGDSVDLVPLGAYHGRGKRTGVYGAYLLACRDEETEEYQSVCKIGTGFSDDDLKSLYSTMKQHIIPEKSSQYNVSDTLECDVWFDTVQVWEVKAADLSKSSTHKGALGRVGEADRGIGLRFPRFERVRDDKKPEQATSSEQILEMYYQQDSVVDADGNGNGDLTYDDDDGI